jgi:imidazolonepropionase-like amidohydrolase
MVEAGLTPMQAITNATSNAAALLKLDDRGVLISQSSVGKQSILM